MDEVFIVINEIQIFNLCLPTFFVTMFKCHKQNYQAQGGRDEYYV